MIIRAEELPGLIRRRSGPLARTARNGTDVYPAPRYGHLARV